MKIIVAIFMLYAAFVYSLNVFSQEYIPMNFSNGVWIEENYTKGIIEIIQHYCIGDTMIKEIEYKKLYKASIIDDQISNYPDTVAPYYIGAIRNNDSRQIEFIQALEDSAIVIYDFDIELNDTIEKGAELFIVNSIDSIEICGSYHKRYIQMYYDEIFSESLIEGIGYTNGLLGYFYDFNFFSESTYSLKCYSEWNNELCSNCEIILSSPNVTAEFKFFPNPSKDRIYFSSSKPVEKICMKDIQGKILINKHFNFETSGMITLTDQLAGIFIAHIQFYDHSSRAILIIKSN